MDMKEVAKRMCEEELKASIAYSTIADMEKDTKLKEMLKKISEDEKRHYEFWKKVYGSDCKVKTNRTLIKLLRKIFGIYFTIKLLERGEEDAIFAYTKMMEVIEDPELKKELGKIIDDERRHEKFLSEKLKDMKAKYVGYIALGLADAVVEITGVHAGFLGATDNPIMAGLAGIIVGFSASLSMGGAAYVQAKHDPDVRPPVSAAVTLISYLFSVIMLALPYFLLKSVILAFASSLIIAMIIMGIFIFYSSVIQDKDFWREYLETLALLFLTALGSYAFGYALESILRIKVPI